MTMLELITKKEFEDFLKMQDHIFKLVELKTKTSPYEASKYFAQEYERCARCDQQSSWTKRGGFAQQVFDYCNNGTGSSDNKTLTPKPQTCNKTAVPLGLNGSGNLNGATSVMLRDSSGL